MIQLHIQKRESLNALISFRKGEQKLGETVHLCESLDTIKDSSARFVVFGICEDIGVQANYGNKGAKKAWNAFLKAFVNVQHTIFNDGTRVLILGKITVTPTNILTPTTPKTALGEILTRIDKKVATVVASIISCGKIPIIIGGGHNNALGNLKGSYQVFQKPLNAINIDAHTDLRYLDYRHSGNGFRYALENKEAPFLNKYAIFGLHKNYTPQYIYDYMAAQKEVIFYELFENITETNIKAKFQAQLEQVSQEAFGLELDCDAMQDFPSSAQTPTGFTLHQVRGLIASASLKKTCTYFHICEAAPSKKNRDQVGKALSYLVTDFIRFNNDHHPIS